MMYGVRLLAVDGSYLLCVPIEKTVETATSAQRCVEAVGFAKELLLYTSARRLQFCCYCLRAPSVPWKPEHLLSQGQSETRRTLQEGSSKRNPIWFRTARERIDFEFNRSRYRSCVVRNQADVEQLFGFNAGNRACFKMPLARASANVVRSTFGMPTDRERKAHVAELNCSRR